MSGRVGGADASRRCAWECEVLSLRRTVETSLRKEISGEKDVRTRRGVVVVDRRTGVIFGAQLGLLHPPPALPSSLTLIPPPLLAQPGPTLCGFKRLVTINYLLG